MNYTLLINRVLEKLELTLDQVNNINIFIPEGRVIVLTTSFQKYTVNFSDLPGDAADYDQEPQPRPKRVKAVKRVGL